MSGKIKNIITIIVGITIGILLVGFVIPIRLEVEINPYKLYQYEDMTREDVSVYLSPLFKRGRQVTDFKFEKTSSDQFDDVTVQEVIFHKSVHIRNVKLDHIDAVYSKTVHEGDPFEKSSVLVTAYYKDDSTQEIQNFDVLNATETLDVNSDIVIKTDLGSARLQIPFLELTELQAEYTLTPHEGDAFQKEAVEVNLVYADGQKIPVKTFDYEGSDTLRGKSNYVIYTSYGDTPLEITPVKITSVSSAEKCYEGIPFSNNIIFEYEDGTDKSVPAEEVEFESNEDMTAGLNEIPFKWKGMSFTLYVYAEASTPISRAIADSEEEVNASIYNEKSSDMFMTIRKIGTDRQYLLTHVVLADPTQIKVYTANNEYGTMEDPLSAAKKSKWTIGANGSFFDPLTGMTVNPSCIIRNSQIILSGTTTGFEICITNDGGLFSPPAGVSAQELINAGVKDILITTDPLLIQDGSIYSEGDSTVSGMAPRTAIGMVTPGEYYLVTSDDGLTYAEMQGIFAELGCVYARSLDGGSSTTLMYKEKYVNNSMGRPVADYICFTK